MSESHAEARRIAARLEVWADARDKRNPYGHGKTGTALLRDAAALLTEQDALREGIASAMTSLATGPGKDGYAYSVLAALPIPKQQEDERER